MMRRRARIQCCSLCHKPVDLAEPHITITRCVETEANGEVTVLEADVLEYMHRACPDTAMSDAAALAVTFLGGER